jgi:hypothetical protein
MPIANPLAICNDLMAATAVSENPLPPRGAEGDGSPIHGTVKYFHCKQPNEFGSLLDL